jgi:DNA-binding protein HU-beta
VVLRFLGHCTTVPRKSVFIIPSQRATFQSLEGFTMTKEELIAKMALSANISKVAAGTALNAFTGAVAASLKKGHRVTLVNFGTFGVARRKARAGRNPRTGESLRIPAARVAKFSPGKALKSAVR